MCGLVACRISVVTRTRESRAPVPPDRIVTVMSTLTYMRSYADADGGSHMEPAELELASKDFVPPASPIDVSALQGAMTYGFLRVPSGYVGEWHPSPQRQWLFFLSGEMEFTMTDGTVYTGRPGSAVLLEDTTGRGHQSRVLGGDAVMAAVQLP